MKSYSKVVAAGMKRVTNDLSTILQGRGFKRVKGGRTWLRSTGAFVQTVHLQRSGSSYGAPINASVDLRLMLSVRRENEEPQRDMIISDKARRPTGYAYHHRFNAETGSTYDRCVQELAFYIEEVAEPWFEGRLRALEGN